MLIFRNETESTGSRPESIYKANTNIGGRIHTKFWSPDSQTSECCGEYLNSDNYFMLNSTKKF